MELMNLFLRLGLTLLTMGASAQTSPIALTSSGPGIFNYTLHLDAFESSAFRTNDGVTLLEMSGLIDATLSGAFGFCLDENGFTASSATVSNLTAANACGLAATSSPLDVGNLSITSTSAAVGLIE